MVSEKVKEALEAHEYLTPNAFRDLVNYRLRLTITERNELADELKKAHPEIYGDIK